MSRIWKNGRGKLGFLQPLMGQWRAEADSPMGHVRCTRSFEAILHGSYIRLNARWEFGEAALERDNSPSNEGGRAYEEIAIIGVGDEGKIGFWSFTSDGKRSQGILCDVTDIHSDAVGFEAQMPAGIARMAYWLDDDDGFFWVVESKTKKGWNRMVEHHYRPL